MNLGNDTLLAKLDRLPPVIVRLFFARLNGRLMTDKELRQRTGWGKKRLLRVYRATSWKNVTVGEVDALLSACGLRWSSQRRQLFLLQLAIERGGLERMRHLRATTFWERQMINNLIKQYHKLVYPKP